VVIAVVGGLLIIGTALAYAAARMVGQVRELYAREQQAWTKAALALQAKTDFLADASHELRTPLTVVRTNAEVGARLEDDPSQREIFEVVEDLLFLARSDSDSLPLEMEVLPVPTFMAEVAGRAEALARERGASFVADLSGDGELRADPTRLEQAILIFVDNAAKYGPAGQPVTLLSTTELGELVIRVKDRGPGIPEEDLSRIFERFYRVDKARERKRGGAGLGLSIAKTIVEAHGGRIEAENRAQGSARMPIKLPLASQSEIEIERS
jgi:two-component system sensor histidine kinase VicK